ncbi:LacI family DNA-binding transcriptional regulator [Deinococcus sonorensis]|uniref:LacI family DNA-binding transcriptional regulator n=2 Tax=Deinococcus sonorensis TaxID=309891 RepID=A0AAU7UFA1_9DEIO
MTVSNVINGKAVVRQDTRQRVLEAIEATGYRVNAVARALAGGRNRMITVFSPQLNRPYATEVIQGAAQAAGKLRYDLIVMMLSEEGFSDVSVMTRLAAGALLIQPSREGRWQRTELPAHVVSVDGPGERRLTVDNYGGARLATEHLLRLGHTRIGFISGLESEDRRPASRPFDPEQHDRDDADERLRGYRDSMAAAGLKVPRNYVQHGDYSKASGEGAALRLLRLAQPPSAIFVSGDAMALGAMHVAQDLGMRVPDELSVVGFDDLPIAVASRPGLTTVRQPLAQIGEVAVQLLVALAEGQAPALPAPFPTELIERESTAPPRDAPPGSPRH